MSEPELIRNDSPHQVSMPEGTNVAAGKKANASEPSVRKVFADADETVNDYSVNEQRVIAPETNITTPIEEQPSFERQLKEEHMVLLPEATPEQSAVVFVPDDLPVTRPEPGLLIKRSAEDRFVVIPETVPEPLSHHSVSGPTPTPALDEPMTAQFDPVMAGSPELSDTLLTMLQMDFPARVVKLKIENDMVRNKLDALQDSFRS